MGGATLTGSIDYVGSVLHRTGWDPVLAGKGIFLSLACFGWAQAAFLVLRGTWAGRLPHIRLALAGFALVAWRPWLGPNRLNWYWSVEATAVIATFVSVLAGVMAGRAAVTVVLKARMPQELRSSELIAAGSGSVLATWALVAPSPVLSFAPFVGSFVLMAATIAMRAKPRLVC
jgi:hypothetical protein